MAKTEKKEVFIDMKKLTNAPEFLEKIKGKVNFINFNVRMTKPNQISILLKGPRERINYAMSIIKSMIEEYKKQEED